MPTLTLKNLLIGLNIILVTIQVTNFGVIHVLGGNIKKDVDLLIKEYSKC